MQEVEGSSRLKESREEVDKMSRGRQSMSRVGGGSRRREYREEVNGRNRGRQSRERELWTKGWRETHSSMTQ